uniref:Transposase n=1 Tax=Globodera rostochiensis TaxID=31243 RepID=A0A914H812_GLORO
MPAPTNFGQNVHHQIDRQNTQFGQIEPNSTDQNPPLTESDHSDNDNSSENIAEDERKYKIVAKKLGLSERTLYKWKSELVESKPKHMYSDSEQMELMKRYYEIKDKNPISDENIAKMLKIGTRTLVYWKKQFKQKQLHQNSVAAANVQEIGISNSGSI